MLFTWTNSENGRTFTVGQTLNNDDLRALPLFEWRVRGFLPSEKGRVEVRRGYNFEKEFEQIQEFLFESIDSGLLEPGVVVDLDDSKLVVEFKVPAVRSNHDDTLKLRIEVDHKETPWEEAAKPGQLEQNWMEQRNSA